LKTLSAIWRKGSHPYEAAVKGAKEIGFTIVSMTISLVAAFIPVLFMTGMPGGCCASFPLPFA
jgi:multidrug efflux pump subunit AcrB